MAGENMTRENNLDYKDNSVDEPIFSIENNITFEQYRWTNKSIRTLAPLVMSIMMILVGLFMICFGGDRVDAVGGISLAGGVILLTLYYVIFPQNIKKTYAALVKNGEEKGTYDFYIDKVVRRNNMGTVIIRYDQIRVVKENDIYMSAFVPVNRIICLEKKDLTEEQMGIIRNAVSDEQKDKYEKAVKKRKIVISIFMAVYLIYMAVVFVFLG